MWLVLCPFALASPDAAALRQAWDAHAAVLEAHTRVPVSLEYEDFNALARGGAIARRMDTPQGTFATAAILIDMPIAAPWVLICDAPHAPPSPASTERIPRDLPPGDRTVHMLLDLPWPLDDRQWVSELRPNRELHGVDPSLWQRVWTAGDPSLAIHPDPKAVWVGTNTGAWTLLDLGGQTLAVFSVRTVLGGAIPTGLSQSFLVAGLSRTMEGLAAASLGMRTHYDAAHEVIVGPDGQPIPAGLGR